MKAGEHRGGGASKRVGLVATNSIRGGATRSVLERATGGSPIFDAWSDEPWVIDGAAVRVPLVCFSQSDDELTLERRLDGETADDIYTDLTARRGGAGVDLTKARRLARNEAWPSWATPRAVRSTFRATSPASGFESPRIPTVGPTRTCSRRG